jgi:acyl-CoA reductase-like NAD-dependent aldehyde dehydrogenase
MLRAEADPQWKDGPILDQPSLRVCGFSHLLSTAFCSLTKLTGQHPTDPNLIQCYDKCTGRVLCDPVPAMNKEQVNDVVARARAAQQQWVKTSFAQRKEVLNALLNFVVDNQEALCRVACRDTGKTSTLCA